MWLMMINNNNTGWWCTYPLKNHGVKVSWDDDYSQLNGKIIYINVPNHQPASHSVIQFFEVHRPLTIDMFLRVHSLHSRIYDG